MQGNLHQNKKSCSRETVGWMAKLAWNSGGRWPCREWLCLEENSGKRFL